MESSVCGPLDGFAARVQTIKGICSSRCWKSCPQAPYASKRHPRNCPGFLTSGFAKCESCVRTSDFAKCEIVVAFGRLAFPGAGNRAPAQAPCAESSPFPRLSSLLDVWVRVDANLSSLWSSGIANCDIVVALLGALVARKSTFVVQT